MPTAIETLELTIEDWAQELSSGDYLKDFLDYCEDILCVRRDEYATKESFNAYYEFFLKHLYERRHFSPWVINNLSAVV